LVKKCDGVCVCVTVLNTELGVKRVLQPDTAIDSPEASHSSGVTDWEEKDREFQVSDAVR
jgi:hypothetical protein